MVPTLVLALALSPAADPLGPKAYPPVYIPAEAPYGYLYRPAYVQDLFYDGSRSRYIDRHPPLVAG